MRLVICCRYLVSTVVTASLASWLITHPHISNHLWVKLYLAIIHPISSFHITSETWYYKLIGNGDEKIMPTNDQNDSPDLMLMDKARLCIMRILMTFFNIIRDWTFWYNMKQPTEVEAIIYPSVFGVKSQLATLS